MGLSQRQKHNYPKHKWVIHNVIHNEHYNTHLTIVSALSQMWYIFHKDSL